MRPHYSHSSRENATPSSGTSPLASCKGVPPPPGELFNRYFKKSRQQRKKTDRMSQTGNYVVADQQILSRLLIQEILICLLKPKLTAIID